MNNCLLLDCTLRDGGYINNWDFGNKIIEGTINNLSESSIEFIECGFLSETKKSTSENSIFNTVSEAEKHITRAENSRYALMLNCGEYSLDDLEEYSGGSIDTIRVAFHKNQCEDAMMLGKKIKEKGFKLFFQPMVTLSYSDHELLTLVEWANKNGIEAFYIVDSFGTMRKNDVLRIFYLLNNNLSEDIMIGFHSHNNLQLSFSNAQELISLHSKRDIIIDTSVLGMGRGAGNLCTELMTQYINENISVKYDIIPILEIMDEYIMPIYSESPWGYSAPYYIAAVNNCHPNYATFLMNRQSLCIRDINQIIKNIPEESKPNYNEMLVKDMYLEYQSNVVEDRSVIEAARDMCRGREVLIIAPGKSIIKYKNVIEKYISERDPVIFGINHIPDFSRYDCVFISNSKRFKNIDDMIEKINGKIICTSNITQNKNASIINYSEYLNDEEVISDNSGLMLINFLKKAGITEFVLAGYDGFSYLETNNYYDGKMINNTSTEHRNLINSAITKYFSDNKDKINVRFITPTIYDSADEN